MQTVKTYHATINPFRPGSGLFPPCLAGRLLDVELFSSRLYSTITGTPKNMIVHGDRKMGKTSLLIRMERMAEEKKLLIVSTIASPVELEEFVSTLAVRLFMEARHQGIGVPSDLETVLEEFHQATPKSFQDVEIRFTDFLLKVWQRIKNHVPALVFSVDDLDLVLEPDRALGLLQNITKNIFRRDCPVIFLVSTSTLFFEEVKKKHPDLTHYFEPVALSKLQLSSLVNAIQVPLWDLNVSYDEAVVKEIARRSDGFPFYLQAVAHYVFEEMNGEFDTLALRRGYAKAMRVLERDVFLPLYASITPTEAKIYLEIFQNPTSRFTQLLKQLGIPKGSVASSLKRLKEKQLIQQDSKMYRVTDRLFGSYLEKKMQEERQKEPGGGFSG